MDSEEFLKLILSQLTDYPDSIRISKTTDERGVLLSVYLAPTDMGKVIGREGVTAKAIKHIINCHGFSQKAKVSVKILDPLPTNY